MRCRLAIVRGQGALDRIAGRTKADRKGVPGVQEFCCGRLSSSPYPVRQGTKRRTVLPLCEAVARSAGTHTCGLGRPPMIGIVRTRRLLGVAVTVMASGCGVMPWVSYGEPPPGSVAFEPGTALEWARHGTPPDFELWPAEENLDWEPGDIYVGVVAQPHGPIRM